ncbi:MAG: AcrB/AcrD/AcrF family protein [Acidobacteria bacterium]|nr:AcrB/AcrD/AcrF family protein [Acidobacteriota bacterium]
MFIPTAYTVALFMLFLSMIAWGSWVNVHKLCKNWRFELLYWDYVWGILLCSLIVGVTFGRTDPGDPNSFFNDLSAASGTHHGWALVAGAIFNLANILIVAAISVAGMAVAFPVGIGLALVIGCILNYVLKPAGNPWFLFGGLVMICLAIILDAVAYRKRSSGVAVSTKGLVLSVVGGILMGLFYPLVVKATTGEGHLGPYGVAFMFALGVTTSNFPLNYLYMRFAPSGPPIEITEYFAGSLNSHFWGLVGGLAWMVGTISNYVASYAQMVGPAASYTIGQGSTMVGTIWGVFVWKEFRGAGRNVQLLLALMFAFFIAGLVCVALAPVV